MKRCRRTVSDSAESLLGWWDSAKRPLPWRTTDDPWAILLSEVVLQQTQVVRGLVHWMLLIEAFPTPEAMAAATEDEVLQLWQGAGYYNRARRLYSLTRRLDGAPLPTTSFELQKLPGIGPYTAAAVASIAHGEPIASVDGNFRRIISRIHEWSEPSSKQIQSAADTLLDQTRPGDWNQAMMDLGAMVCTPRNPDCGACPLSSHCRGKTSPHSFPKPKKRRLVDEHGIALLIQSGDRFFLERRPPGLLGGLWCPPIRFEIPSSTSILDEFGLNNHLTHQIGEVIHTFSHRRWHLDVHFLSLSSPFTHPSGRWDDPSEISATRLTDRLISLLPVT